MNDGLVIDLFAGLGGWSCAAAAHDLDEIGIEIDLWACRTRRAAGHRTIRADVATFPLERLTGRVEGLIASPPCFPAGTPVLTDRGILPIEQVAVGDRVLTHLNRWRRVERTMSREAETLQVGHLEATPDHPFWTRSDADAAPDWTPFADSTGRYVATPRAIPAPGNVPELADREWYVVGRWLGDGWVRLAEAEPSGRERVEYSALPRDCEHCGRPAARHARYSHLFLNYCSRRCSTAASQQRTRKSRGSVFICCAHDEADKLEVLLRESGTGHWRRDEQRTATRFELANIGKARWLTEHFGRYAHGKTVPAWVFGLPASARAALLEGYLDADGYDRSDNVKTATTVSPCLASGIRLIAESLGLLTWQARNKHRPGSVIEGRTITQRQSDTIGIREDDGRYTWTDSTHRWTRLRAKTPMQRVATVYDLSVAEDESFVANSVVVHNCTDWSQSGKRAGLDGETGSLVLEVDRWVRALMPRWVVCEQVPPALQWWNRFAYDFKALGYSTWAGILNSADYGVPQTRERAILICSLDRTVGPPPATHAKNPQPSLFGSELVKWVSMAQALGWGATVRPITTIAAGHTRGTVGGGSGGRRSMERERDVETEPAPVITASADNGNFRFRVDTRGDSGRSRDSFNADDRPARVVTHSVKDWQFPGAVVQTGNNSHVTSREGSKAGEGGVELYERSVDEPAPTLDTGAGGKWRVIGVNTGRDWKAGGTRDDAQVVPPDEPAPTVDATGRWHALLEHEEWTEDRPATTVQGDPRIWPPGHKINADDERRLGAEEAQARYRDRAGSEAIRLTIIDALILQSFDPDYPVQGNKTKQFEQVGNAIPPLLAWHVLGQVVGE